MIAELGHFSLILALGMCVALAIIPTVGIVQKNAQLMNVSNSLAAGFFVLLGLRGTDAVAARVWRVAWASFHQTRSRVVSLSMLGPFGPRRGRFPQVSVKRSHEGAVSRAIGECAVARPSRRWRGGS